MLQLNEILGQASAVGVLKSALAAQRLPHGMIFAGPAGVGKATTARALAAVFLCEKPDLSRGAACGRCESCRLMEVGNHPDFHVAYRQLIRLLKKTSVARDFAMDVVRHFVVRPAGLKAAMGRGKVIVLEEAELMNADAQNALLKTLEEPQGRTLIILLSDQPEALLPTIRSRCQIVRFALLDPELVERELLARGISAADVRAATSLSEGSLGLAMKWLEDGVVELAQQLVEQLEAISAGRATGDLQGWLKKAADAYAEAQLKRDELASKDQATREGLSVYLRIASNLLRNQLRELDSSSEGEAIERTCCAIDAIATAESNLDTNVNIPLTLQQLAVAFERELAPN
jgi:DNA polymerase-3 subunit delta'